MTQYIISQVFAVAYYILILLTFYVKSRKKILILNLSALFMEAVSFFLLSAWVGLAMMGVALLRNIIFLIQNRKDSSEKIKVVDILILAVLLGVSITSTVLTYEGFLSLFAFFATMTYTVAVWQKNINVYKILGVVSSIFWIIYNIFIFSLFGIIMEVILFIAEVVSVIKVYVQRKRTVLTGTSVQTKTEVSNPNEGVVEINVVPHSEIDENFVPQKIDDTSNQNSDESEASKSSESESNVTIVVDAEDKNQN